MPDLKVSYWIQGSRNVREEGYRAWETLAEFPDLDSAQMALADARTYPMNRHYRIIKVEKVV